MDINEDGASCYHNPPPGKATHLTSKDATKSMACADHGHPIFVELRTVLRELDEFTKNLPASMSFENKRAFLTIAARLGAATSSNFTDPSAFEKRKAKASKATKNIRDLIDNTSKNHRYL